LSLAKTFKHLPLSALLGVIGIENLEPTYGTVHAISGVLVLCDHPFEVALAHSAFTYIMRAFMRETATLEARPKNHEVFFYSDDAAYVETVANFLAAALSAGGAAIAFSTKPHRDLLYQALTVQDVDIDAAIERGAFISLDAAEVLASFMVNGWPDQARFFEGFGHIVGSALKAAKSQNPRLAVFGEAVALLCEDGNIEGAIRLEQLGNYLANKYEVDILCAYPLKFCDREHDNQVKRICAQHSTVFSR